MASFVGSAVIEHLAQPAVGHRVLCAAGELVEHLVLVKDQNAEVVGLLMQLGHTAGLVEHTAGLVEIGTGRHDNHVGRGLAMDILVGNLAQQLRVRIGTRFVKGHKLASAPTGGSE